MNYKIQRDNHTKYLLGISLDKISVLQYIDIIVLRGECCQSIIVGANIGMLENINGLITIIYRTLNRENELKQIVKWCPSTLISTTNINDKIYTQIKKMENPNKMKWILRNKIHIKKFNSNGFKNGV